jgi:hypothetical protein
MSYTLPECMAIFSDGQISKMHEGINKSPKLKACTVSSAVTTDMCNCPPKDFLKI